MLDLILLQVLRSKDKYDRLRRAVPLKSLDEHTSAMIKIYDRYYKDYPDAETIDRHKLRNTIKFYFKNGDKEDVGLYEAIAEKATAIPDEDAERVVTNQLLEVDFRDQASNMIQQYMDGQEVDLMRDMYALSEKFKLQVERKIDIPWINTTINDLLEEDESNFGLSWRLRCLNESMRPLRGGDFGVIAGRPDTGKTTFIASEITYMARQFDETYDEERYVLWFNNEGCGKRIVTRIYQSALGCSIKELIDKKNKGTIEQEYINAVGRIDRIRVLDIHDMWSYDIEEILEKMNPGLVVLDMVDNIRFSGSASGSRTDQVLEQMYQWARVLGVKYDCPIMATSQISNDGDGMAFPTLGMLKDSKTGKQGACDYQLMIGKSNDPNMECSRFLGLPKNKLAIEGGKKDPRSEVIFDGLRARYKMPEAV